MNARTTNLGARVGAARGFTLLELLLAIGVLTFVSVAIAAIFGTIGDTLDRGKRISELNQFASRIESVMRQDFANMSRDGFLVIRHEYAAAGLPTDGLIPLSEGDPNPRPRRVDQIMFFATGEYTSARPDIYAGLSASSNEARIYYGHGQKRTPDFDPGSPYLEPDLRDDLVGERDFQFRDAAARLGTPSTPGLPNPNEFASDWTLLRHVTLLKPPAPQLAQLLPDYSDGGLYGYTADREAVNFSPTESEPAIQRKVVTDRPYQVALQPAIPSIFWNAQSYQFGGNPNDLAYIESVANPVWVGYGPAELRDARFSSGLVDIATTSLAEIESYVTSAPFQINADGFNITNRARFYLLLGIKFPEEAKINPNGGPSIQNYPNRYPFAFTSPAQQRAWMINALPVHPGEPFRDIFGNEYEISDRSRGPNYTGPTSPRIRYEELPPNLAGTLTDAGGNQGNARDRLVNAYRAADQEMLTRSIFVPRCTEFIVEWTFG
ncbi:MAG: type II secretion system protein J, partial [Phycisphaerales bacterium JB040]